METILFYQSPLVNSWQSELTDWVLWQSWLLAFMLLFSVYTLVLRPHTVDCEIALSAVYQSAANTRSWAAFFLIGSG